MINKEQFTSETTEILKWIADYLDRVENYPVRAASRYGEIKSSLPEKPPVKGETTETLLKDFNNLVLPGITHWQSPKFFAYFPANSSIPSIQAEFLTAALGVQGMKWITSPAATEMEERMMEWLRDMLSLPLSYTGVLQDTASVSTLCAILAARERSTGGESNSKGMNGYALRVYCSTEAHSSIEKAVRIAGIGSQNLVKIEVDEQCRLIPHKLEEALEADITKGYTPCCIVGALGTTGSCAVDPLQEMGRLARQYAAWFHIDAAFAGTALMLPEYRKTVEGLELADSFVFNPHKWMFTNFDCSAFYVRDPKQLQTSFQLVPAYLQAKNDSETNDFSNWGIQLGRRFRALKLWFVIRSFGIEGLQKKLRHHLALAEKFEAWVTKNPHLEQVVPRNLVVTCFRYIRPGLAEEKLNQLNAFLLEKINASGKIYISHTFIHGKYSLRLVCAQTQTEKRHVEEAMQVIQEKIIELESESDA